MAGILEQSWFVARVPLALTLLVAIPFTVLVSFTLNILLRELGAADLSGAGAASGAVTQVGPLVTVLIVGAGATAMCADLGSGPSATRSTRWRFWGSTRQATGDTRACWRRVWSRCCSTACGHHRHRRLRVLGLRPRRQPRRAFAAGITLLTGVPR